MNVIVLLPTSLSPLGDTATPVDGPRDRGFSALLDAVGSTQDPLAPRARDIDTRSDVRDDESNTRPERARVDRGPDHEDRDTRPDRTENKTREDQSRRTENSQPHDHDTANRTEDAEATGTAAESGRSYSDHPSAGKDANSGAGTRNASQVSSADDNAKTGTTPDPETKVAVAPKAVTTTADGITGLLGGGGVSGLPQTPIAVTPALSGEPGSDVPIEGTSGARNSSGQTAASPVAAPSTTPHAGIGTAATSLTSGGSPLLSSPNAGAPTVGSGITLASTGALGQSNVEPTSAAKTDTPVRHSAQSPALGPVQNPTQNPAAQLVATLTTAIQNTGVPVDQALQIKATAGPRNGAPAPLVSPGLLALAKPQGGNRGADPQGANGDPRGGSSAGGKTTSSAADVLLNARIGGNTDILGSTPQVPAAKTLVGFPATSTPPIDGAVMTGSTVPATTTGPVSGTGIGNGAGHITSQASSTARAGASPAEQVSIQLARAAQTGLTRFNIKLQPEELGRLEVRMEVARDGKIHALMIADRQDTLDMLQRDARGLERALQGSGLKTDSNSLSFSLRSQDNGGGGGMFAQADDARSGPPRTSNDETPLLPEIAALATPTMGADGADGRLNILV